MKTEHAHAADRDELVAAVRAWANRCRIRSPGLAGCAIEHIDDAVYAHAPTFRYRLGEYELLVDAGILVAALMIRDQPDDPHDELTRERCRRNLEREIARMQRACPAARIVVRSALRAVLWFPISAPDPAAPGGYGIIDAVDLLARGL